MPGTYPAALSRGGHQTAPGAAKRAGAEEECPARVTPQRTEGRMGPLWIGRYHIWWSVSWFLPQM